MKNTPEWPILLWSFAVALALLLAVKSDLAHLRWVSELSKQGSPPPQRDSGSETGYVHDQRQLLGTHRRGETYRWIATTQDLIASGPFGAAWYDADNAPTGRPQLTPKLYAFWLGAVSWAIHIVTGEPIAISVEMAALWEPLISHVLALVAAALYMWIRHGPAAGGLTGFFFALFPPVSGQFLPGALTTETWALLFTTYAVAVTLPSGRQDHKDTVCSARSAVAAAVALWLDPGYGFPAVLITGCLGLAAGLSQKSKVPWLRWSLVGGAATIAAWLIDQGPWSPAAGELRYVHPLYALAWLGIGLGMDAWQRKRAGEVRRRLYLAEILAAIPLLGALAYVQLGEGFKGWLYTSASMRRLTSLDETSVFDNAFDWIVGASLVEWAFVSMPALAATAALVLLWRRKPGVGTNLRWSVVVATVAWGCLLVLALCKLRWLVVASLVALPLVALFASSVTPAFRRGLLAASAFLLILFFAWDKSLPTSFRKASAATPPGAADLQSLIYRHFSHWMASHNPGRKVVALAPPELADSLVFHGDSRVLMSTAWESYPGQVAASRILSAPESSEADAVLQSLDVTHVVITSWDKVLPLLVKEPQDGTKDTLYERLQRWVFPLFMRPIPYHLPPVPGYAAEKLVAFKVVPPLDEAQSLSLLAEYFVEMDREEPAGVAAKALEESFGEDPNAVIARATVYAHARNQAAFDRELKRLAADAAAGRAPFSWDRRVQRAIVLTLGRERELARSEIEACVSMASREEMFDLTPLQAFRLRVLAQEYGYAFADKQLAGLLESLGAEYSSRQEPMPTR